jgi:hypothetical protein
MGTLSRKFEPQRSTSLFSSVLCMLTRSPPMAWQLDSAVLKVAMSSFMKYM